jgi:hypothetical protein
MLTALVFLPALIHLRDRRQPAATVAPAPAAEADRLAA